MLSLGFFEAVRRSFDPVDAALRGGMSNKMRAHSRNASLVLALVTVIAAGGPNRSLNAQDPAPQPPATQPPSPPPAGQAPERAQQPPIRTGINYVRVDAILKPDLL